MELASGRAALRSLKAEVARLREENERLEKQAKQMEKEIQQLKNQGTRTQVQTIAERLLSQRSLEIGLIVLVGAPVPGLEGHESLRILADSIRKKEKTSIIFLSDQWGNCIVYCDEDAQKVGIQADALLKFAAEEMGGSGGGKADRAQGRLKDPNRLMELRDWLTRHLREKAKKS